MTEEQKEKTKESNKRYLQNMTEEQREERKEYYKRRNQIKYDTNTGEIPWIFTRKK